MDRSGLSVAWWDAPVSVEWWGDNGADVIRRLYFGVIKEVISSLNGFVDPLVWLAVDHLCAAPHLEEGEIVEVRTRRLQPRYSDELGRWIGKLHNVWVPAMIRRNLFTKALGIHVLEYTLEHQANRIKTLDPKLERDRLAAYGTYCAIDIFERGNLKDSESF